MTISSNAHLFIDLQGESISKDEIARVRNPIVAGVILFSRNYKDPDQLRQLTGSIKAARADLIIAVDQEGGRIQRFREGFTTLPSPGELGALYQSNPSLACSLAYSSGWMMASELRACGVDLSFAPVLDLDYDGSTIIGNRAFSIDPETVVSLSTEVIRGMNAVGMRAVGKHFPGHGSVVEDSHHVTPVDTRGLTQMNAHDLIPFTTLVEQNLLAGVMPAHIIYSEVDSQPASFSRRWLDQILRTDLQFQGVVFSDDLAMQGAAVIGSFAQRAQQALAAGCDILLVCNDIAAQEEVTQCLMECGSSHNKDLSIFLSSDDVGGLSLLHDSSVWQEHKNTLNQLESEMARVNEC